MVLHGIDVSSYQPGINLKSVPGDFVIVKATEGTNYTNPYFNSQIESALSAGKLIGIYHFASAGNWKNEADYFIRTVKRYVGKAILVLDDEGTAVTAGGGIWALNFMNRVYEETGIKPLLYTGLADENRVNWSPVAKKYKLWVAQYNDMNPHYGYKPRSLYGSLRYWKSSTIFQYSATGILNGWNGSLDLNVFYGNKADWQKLAGSSVDKGSDDEMSWSVKVRADEHVLGGFCVTKRKGASLWTEPNNKKLASSKLLPYNSNWEVLGVSGCFLKLGKDQWVDSRTGIFKLSPFPSDKNLHCRLSIEGKAKFHEQPHDEGYGKNIPKGTILNAEGFQDGYFKTKNGYVNSAKVKIVLG